MTSAPPGFDTPIYVTRPMFPPLPDYVERLEKIWASGQLTNGGRTHVELEQGLAAYFGTENVALFNNGTIALLVALKALRLEGEVITTPFTFPATTHAITWAGLTPVFADIDADTMNIDPAAIERLVTPKTSAILPVHVFGEPCDVVAIQDIADRHGLKVIYDAAHAFGSKTGGRLVTEFGSASMLSFHATKLFHTAEGGAIITRDAALKRDIELLRNFGIVNETTVLTAGINGKLNELQAALGVLTLEAVGGEQVRRAEIRAIYRERLGRVPGVLLSVERPTTTLSQQYFAIRVRPPARLTADQLAAELKRFNVFARRYFYPLCSTIPCYSSLPSASPGHLPVATAVAKEVLCLPYYGRLSDDDVHRVADLIAFLLTD